jgi:hypothetical protein
MAKKKLIFYQSIAEISEIIEILKKSPYGTYFIIVTGGRVLTNLLKKIKLKKDFGVKIYEFQALRLKNPINILKMYFRFNHSRDAKKILSFRYHDVIFFNYSYDFVTPIFLSKINSKKISFVNFYQRKFTNGKPKLKELIQKFIIKILHKNINVKMLFDKKYEQIFFFPKDKKIKEISKTNKIPKSIFDLPIPRNNKKKNIIYFDAFEEKIYGASFKQTLLKIFELADKADLNIIIKKHPVSDLSKCVNYSKKWSYILEPFPIELYKLSKVEYVFGLSSLSLSKICEKYPKIKVFSFLNLLKVDKNTLHMRKYLQKMMKSGIIYFPNNFNQIKEILTISVK